MTRMRTGFPVHPRRIEPNHASRITAHWTYADLKSLGPIVC
jgi:hypothetical protein